MAKNEVVVRQVGGTQLAETAPDWMQQDERMGLETLAKKIRPPFLKIIQKQSADELIKEFGAGSAILTPTKVLVLDTNNLTPVRIVPIFFYVEYLKLSPMSLKDSEPMIKDRSLDPSSELARKCQNRALWLEDHPSHKGNPKFAYRNCEALNFLCLFQEEHLQLDRPFILSFSRGSYGKGQAFCDSINMRRRPIFGQVHSLTIDPTPGQNASGTWSRFLIENPPERPWVDNQEEYELYKTLHLQLKEEHAKGNIEAEYDSNDLSEGSSTTGEYAPTA